MPDAEGEKTIVFWIGLIILALASVGLFGILWIITVWMIVVYYGYMDLFRIVIQTFPVIVGGVVFILIGLYMMRSGVKESVGGAKTKGGDHNCGYSSSFDCQYRIWFSTLEIVNS